MTGESGVPSRRRPPERVLSAFDTGPLTYLDTLGYLPSLKDLYRVMVPDAVVRELALRPGAPGSGAPRLRFAELLSPDPANMDRVVGGTPSIEAGEREVIALVLGTGATAVMDDRRAHSSGRRTSEFTGKSSS